MQTYYAVETEVEHRRRTWEREAVMDERIARARSEHGRTRLQRMRSLVQNHMAAVTRSLTHVPSRRALLRGLTGACLGLAVSRLPDSAEAKKRRTKRRRKNKDAGPLCARNGEGCETHGDNCQARYCLKAPFTIEALRENGATHGTYLFVPPETGATGPSPYTHYYCGQDASACDERYPFACVNQDAQAPGNEIATIYELLPGIYEYWIDLINPATAGDLVIVLKDNGGRVVRQWPNPANTTARSLGWRVFDVDGDGRVTSIDATLSGFYEPSTDVCPYTTLGRQDRDRAAIRARSHRP